MPHVTKRASQGRTEDLLALIDRFQSKTVVVVGDLVADEFVYGEIARVSREAPVLILKHHETVTVPGGGANAAYNLGALGARVLPVGIVGNDRGGRALLDRFQERGVDTRGIVMAREHLTVTKSRILAGVGHGSRQQVVRVDTEPSEQISEARVNQIERCAVRLAARADAVLLSDYGYGAVAPSLIPTLKPLLDGRPITVDSHWSVQQYVGATAATPNEPEAESACNVKIGRDTKKLEQAGRALLKRMQLAAMLITRGAQGMALFEPGRPTLHIPVWGSDEVADVTGAGDTVIAAFTLALAAGGTFEDAARIANFAGGVVVTKRGTATVSAQELRSAVLSYAEQEQAAASVD